MGIPDTVRVVDIHRNPYTKTLPLPRYTTAELPHKVTRKGQKVPFLHRMILFPLRRGICIPLTRKKEPPAAHHTHLREEEPLPSGAVSHRSGSCNNRYLSSNTSLRNARSSVEGAKTDLRVPDTVRKLEEKTGLRHTGGSAVSSSARLAEDPGRVASGDDDARGAEAVAVESSTSGYIS